MYRTLAALALAVASPLPILLPGPAHAQVVVRSGETLSELAERHGVSLSRLMQANGISNPDHVMVGQTLVIPGSGGSGSRAASGRGGKVTVQPGDTLSEIAAREGVGLTALMQANGLGNADHVMVGEQLVIPGRGSRGSGATARAAAKSTPTAPYTVKSGETLSDIASRFGTSTERLIQINRLSDPDHVMAGSRLQIPGRPGARPAAKSSAAAKEHVVSPGESLGEIADRYGTSVARLSALNGLDDPDLVHSGMRLKLVGTPPAKTAAAPTAKSTPKPAAKPTAQPSAQPVAKAVAEPAASPQPAAAAPAARPAPQQTEAAGRADTAEEPNDAPATAPAAQQPLTQASGALAPRAEDVTGNLAPRAAVAPDTTALVATTAATMPAAATATRSATSRVAAVAPQASRSRLALATAGVGPVSQAMATPAATTTATTATATAATTTATTATAAAAATRSSPTSSGTTIAARSLSSSTPKPASSGPASASSASSSDGTHDWRSYGPLQVDWANWKPMGGSYVAPTLNSEGDPLYLAINCGARKVNATSQTGQWKTWEDPSGDDEQKLVSDLCKTKDG